MKDSFLQYHTVRPDILSVSVAIALVCGIAVSGAAAQDDEQFSVSGAVEVGAEHNSNVSISELESATGEADTAAIADAGVDFSWQLNEGLALDAGYSYSGSRYQDFDAFDLDLHLLYGDLSYEFESFTLGSNYYYADASLGGDDFLTLKQHSFYAAKLFSDQWYLRGALNFADKSFDGLALRDADTEGASVDLYWFFNEGRSTLVFGLAYDDEEAAFDAFSYEAQTLRLRYSNRFTLVGRNAELQLGMRLQNRDYTGITPEIGARRDDDQLITEAGLEVSLNDHLAVVTKLQRGSFNSNLSSADYSENRASLTLKLKF